MSSYSQLKQDIFAINTAISNTYIEIGASHPVKINNSYLLESNGWSGFSIELDTSKKEYWDSSDRNNKIYWDDAITFDYLQALEDNNLPNHIGYLSCDIEPPINTFAALQKVIAQGITFDCITFEHDKYQSDIDYDPIVKEYLQNKGYKVAVDNVFRMRKYRLEPNKPKIIKKCYMETWFIHESIYTKTLDYIDWKKLYD